MKRQPTNLSRIIDTMEPPDKVQKRLQAVIEGRLPVPKHIKKECPTITKLLGSYTATGKGPTVKIKDSVCSQADEAVSGPRRQAYGHPKDEFTKTAAIWGALLGCTVTARQVGLCMAALKLVRENHAHKRDNLVDICGYAKCVDLIEECK